ncbi:hypothetical protein O6H91_11G065200 [Diphasiastrum complanatum]|nr:hypothetical protein O6H91_11G065200 [Diphasiastrum complanatum]
MLESIASTTNYSDSFVNEQEGATSFHKISMPKQIEDFDHVEEVDTEDENVEAGLSRSSTEVVSTENGRDREEHAHPITCNKLEVHLTSVFKSEVETFLYKPPFSPSPRETAVDEIDEDFEVSPRTELGERHLKDLAKVTLQLNQAENKPPCISQYSSLFDFTQELVSQAMPPRIPDSVLKEMVEPLEDDCLTSSRNYPLLMNSASNNRNEILDRRCSDLKPEKNEQSNDLKFSSSDTCRVIEKEETKPSKEEDWNSVEATAPLSGRFEVHIGNLKNPKSLEVSCNKGIDEVLEEKIIEVPEDEISEVSEEECLQTVLSTGESGSELEVGGTKLAEKTNLSSKLSGSTSALVPGSLIGNKLFEDEIGEVSEDVSLKTDVYSSDNSDFCQ